MAQAWMIRAGKGGRYLEDFKNANRIAIGWNDMGDLSAYPTDADLRSAYIDHYGNAKPGRTAMAVATIRKFRDEISPGDTVVSYATERREYLIGRVTGTYEHLSPEEEVGTFAHTHRVEWLGTVSRDLLSQIARYSLGSIQTMFSISEEVLQELTTVLEGGAPKAMQSDDEEPVPDSEGELLREEVITKGHELIKDKIQALSPDDMEQLTAALLRAMGYKTRVSPKGPDRGIDVQASPDGLGLTQPRIKAEVKHRSDTIGSNPIRSFIGALRDGDNGLFVSTGGFTREARYEAERATIPVMLIDIDDLAELIVTHYATFDLEGQTLLPLVRVYWPAD